MKACNWICQYYLICASLQPCISSAQRLMQCCIHWSKVIVSRTFENYNLVIDLFRYVRHVHEVEELIKIPFLVNQLHVWMAMGNVRLEWIIMQMLKGVLEMGVHK